MKRAKMVGMSALVLLLLFAPSVYGDQAQEEAAAVAAAQQWLALVDAGKYGESWDQAATFFKGAITKEKWETALNGARRPLGKLLSRTVVRKKFATNLPGAPDGKYVVIQFKTSFENKKSAVETVTPMSDKDGQWRVAGYYIK